jgi:putative hemolysin
MRARDDASWLIDGTMLIDIVSDRLGLVSLPVDRSFDSLAGFLLWQFERLPEEGERIQFDGHLFEVIDMDGPRIDKVLVTRLPDSHAEGDELAGG